MSTAQMDEASRAMCWALRNPPGGQKPMKLKDIRKLILKKREKKRPGQAIGQKRPTLQAISLAAKTYKKVKKQRGRKTGQRATTKDDDKEIMKTFFKLRPAGHGIDSRTMVKGVPKKIAAKIGQRTIIRRLAEKGYVPEKKESKTDLGRVTTKKRLKFCNVYKAMDANQWKAHCQGVGDFKEFTWYPRVLHPQFSRLRSSWTYMNKAEKKKPAFQRPKKWFKGKDWKKVKKMKVFGLTTSTGHQLSFEVPVGKNTYDGNKFAAHVRKRIGPFLRKVFPGRDSFCLLLDGEKVQHTPEAKRAMAEFGITTLKHWPSYSPELNPQEHVWSRAEPELRALENGYDEFVPWKRKVHAAIKKYSGANKLVGSMARKIKDCLERKGAMIDD